MTQLFSHLFYKENIICFNTTKLLSRQQKIIVQIGEAFDRHYTSNIVQ
jgi:hypothetical protein